LSGLQDAPAETRAELLAQIAAERLDLVAILGDLPEQSWDAPSLCSGWRVREVVAHLTLPARMSSRVFLWQLVIARGSVDTVMDRTARRDAAAVPAAELVRTLAEHADDPWKPPGGGYEGALAHDVVHGLDVTVPLGVGRHVPVERVQVALASVCTPRSRRHFGVDLAGVQLRANDLDWTYGDGKPLEGAAQDLLLVLAGRRLPKGHLQGDGADRFTADPATGTLEA